MEDTILKTITVSEKGQITIPREIQKKLGINKGDNLIVAKIHEKIVILLESDFLKILEDDFEDVMKYSESSLEKIWSDKGDKVWEKYLQ